MPDVGSYFDRLVKRATGGRRGKRSTTSATTTSATTTTSTGTRSAKAAVTIEYSPQLDGDPDPGEVVWTWVPFEEDPTQGKDRPVAIIGRRNGALVGIPLTTKRNEREAQVEVGRGGWDPDRRISYARIWRLLEIAEDKMRREGAILERERFDDIIEAVDDYYEVVRRATTGDVDRDD